jgi:CheY-like chemotaxis protein
MHGGTIEVSSAGTGRGATFRIVLPVPAYPPDPAGRSAERATSPGNNAGAPLANLRVLAVDDERDALLLLSEILETAGACVATASSAGTALDALAGETPDVLVADLGMPVMDGFQLIEQVRCHVDARVRDVPAIALTAFARSEDRNRALQAGFHVHLAKPIDPTELVTTVAMLGKHYEIQQE